MNLSPYSNLSYRDDLQSVRAIGALLIMIYHIWLNKVSGGVDVFFVISGYFMTGMLIRYYIKNNTINPFEFWGRILKRIAPLAYLVIISTFIAGYFILPPNLWKSNIDSVLASALHLQNFQLIRAGTDYLQTFNPASPFQQYWALSIQMQLYFILPFVVMVGLFFSRLFKSIKVLISLLITIILFSLSFSIYYTDLYPNVAYFHLATRAWEFFVGGLIFLVAPYLKLSISHSRVLLALGIGLLVTLGLFVPTTMNYPGYVSLLPVLAAVFIIIGGHVQDLNWKLSQLLRSKFLLYVGGISFYLYLWHWPVLIYTQYALGKKPNEIDLIEGLFVISFAFLLAIASKKLIDSYLETVKHTKTLFSYASSLVLFLMIFPIGYYARSEIIEISKTSQTVSEPANERYAGDYVYIQNKPLNLDTSEFIKISNDVAIASKGQCNQGIKDGKIVTCTLGDLNSDSTFLIVGGSRVAQWEPLFSHLAHKYSFKIINSTMNGCSFGHNPKDNEQCAEWNSKIIDYIEQMHPKPDMVIMNTSRNENDEEYIPEGYLKNMHRVLEMGIPVLGVRINPKFPMNPSSCLWENRESPEQCVVKKSSSLNAVNPMLEVKQKYQLDNLHLVDFSEALCLEDRCPATFNQHPTMRDVTHHTSSYVNYMASALEKSLNQQVGGLADILMEN